MATLRATAGWFSSLVRGFLRRRAYVRLNPPLASFHKAYFFDRKKKSVFSVFTRDVIDHGTADQIYSYQHYDLSFLRRYEEIRGVYAQMLKDGKVPLIIDCGGNIGLASRYFAEQFPGALVVCVEPDIGNITQAQRNNAGFKNILYRQEAIGSEASVGVISNQGAENNAFQMTKSAEGGIKIVSIDSIIADAARGNAAATPFLVKIDIEGFESELFSKNIGWIDLFPVMIVETHDWMLPKSANSQNFLRAIAARNRDFIFANENVFSLRN